MQSRILACDSAHGSAQTTAHRGPMFADPHTMANALGRRSDLLQRTFYLIN